MNEEIKNLFMQDLLKNNFNCSKHRFSLRYRCRKNKIIRNYLEQDRVNENKPKFFCYVNVKIPARLRLKYFFIIIVLFSMLLGFTVYRNYSGIFIREYSSYSSYSAQSGKSASDELMKKFYIDYDFGEYRMEVADDDEHNYWIVYLDENNIPQVSIRQSSYESFSGQIGTNDALKTPSYVNVNGWEGVYVQTKNGLYTYIFDTGNFLMEYSGNLDKIEIENIVKMTKFE